MLDPTGRVAPTPLRDTRRRRSTLACATMDLEGDRHVWLCISSDGKYAAVFDNGAGMDSKEVQNMLRMHLSQDARGNIKPKTTTGGAQACAHLKDFRCARSSCRYDAKAADLLAISPALQPTVRALLAFTGPPVGQFLSTSLHRAVSFALRSLPASLPASAGVSVRLRACATHGR